MYENGENNSQNNENNFGNTSQNGGGYSDIRYTYNPNAGFNNQGNTYNTNMGAPQKKKHGNGVFIAIIAVLLCISAAAAGISGWALITRSTNGGTSSVVNSSDPTATPTTTGTANSGSAFGNVVEVAPTPTPTVVEGELLTPQQVATKVIPSVVCIQCYQSSNMFGSTESSTLYSQGSGIISRSDGYIITNAHVISEATSVQVVLNNGTICDATVVGSDSVTDLALLKIDATGLTLEAATFSSVKGCSVADTVLAIGNPGGIEFFSSVTRGIISAVDRSIQDEETGYVMHCIQTDTAINPGNSGGPLVDLYGHVIGITSSKIVASGYESMGFAITYDEAAPIIDDLMQYGHVKNRATLNISLSLASSVFRVSNMYSLPNGLCITAVTGEEENQAGLKKYDIISAIDGKNITSMSDYSSYILSKKPGDTVTLTVYRATLNGWSVNYSSSPISIEVVLSEAN